MREQPTMWFVLQQSLRELEILGVHLDWLAVHYMGYAMLVAQGRRRYAKLYECRLFDRKETIAQDVEEICPSDVSTGTGRLIGADGARETIGQLDSSQRLAMAGDECRKSLGDEAPLQFEGLQQRHVIGV
jgi:hypothetical protein